MHELGSGTPRVRAVRLSTRNPLAVAALAAVVIAVGGALVFVGLALLAGIAVVGGAVGAGVMLYRRLTGRAAPPRATAFRSPDAARSLGLDPSLEVRRVQPGDEK